MSAPILFGEPHFDESEERRVLDVLRSRWIGQGPVVESFERELARYVSPGADASSESATDVVTVSSCTAALELALRAAGVGAGDEVITTPFTFVATLNAIDKCGATPVLVDIDRESLNLLPAAAEAACTPRTRAIVPVHFGGRPLDVAGFDALCRERSLWLIEDAAHAVGTVAARSRVGHARHDHVMACFSFYPNKNLASAEGGAVTVGNPEVAARLRRLRLHGLDNDAWRRYVATNVAGSMCVEPGFKANWTDLQAAIALAQLEKLEGFLAIRESLAEVYDTNVHGVGVSVRPRPVASVAERHALHLYQVEVEGGRARRDAILVEMRSRGVGVAVHYLGVNLHPANEGRWVEPVPVSDWASDSLLTLPLHPGLGPLDQERVVAELAAVSAVV